MTLRNTNTFLGLFLKGRNHKRWEEFPDYIHKHYPNGLESAVKEMAKDGKTPYDDEEYKKKNPKDCLKTESKYVDALPLDDPVLLATVKRLAERLGLSAAPVVAYCDRVAVPAVVGVFRPAIGSLTFVFSSALTVSATCSAAGS